MMTQKAITSLKSNCGFVTKSLVTTTGLVLTSAALIAGPAKADTLTFDASSQKLSDDAAPAKVLVTLDDSVGDGKIQVNVKVVTDGSNPNTADLRGLFFNLDDPDITSLTMEGTDVSASAFNPGKISSVGGSSNNIKGKFDAGVEIGSEGIGENDIQETTFILSANKALSLGMFSNQSFGLRLMSVGLPGSSREGSSKLGGSAIGSIVTTPSDGGGDTVSNPGGGDTVSNPGGGNVGGGGSYDDPVAVPEPATIGGLILAGGGLLSARRRKQRNNQ